MTSWKREVPWGTVRHRVFIKWYISIRWGRWPSSVTRRQPWLESTRVNTFVLFLAAGLPGRFSLSSDQKVLKISNVCKSCSGGTTDLQVFQCKASNGNGHVYASGYLNVYGECRRTFNALYIRSRDGDRTFLLKFGLGSFPISNLFYVASIFDDRRIELPTKHQVLLSSTLNVKKCQTSVYLYSAHFAWASTQRRSSNASCLMWSHSFTCHPYVLYRQGQSKTWNITSATNY